jgi:molybdopterin-containing oxidoreductase family membrane subunit
MKTEKILWGIAAAGFLVGMVGLFQRITGGHTVAAYNTYVPWGLWVALYTMLIGVSVGAYLVVALAYGFRVKALQSVGRIALLTAFAALTGGLLAVWLDLGHPLRFFKLFFSTSFTSVMGVMTWLYTIYGVLLVVLLYLIGKNAKTSAVRILTLVGLVLVVIFGGAEGSLFGVVSAQALWESGLTPILFLVEGALSGVALVMFLTVVLGKLQTETGQILRWVALGLLLTVVVLNWAEFSTALYAGIPAKADSLRVILFGPFWWVFWFINIGLGLLVPLLLLIFAGRNGAALATAGGLVAFTAISAKLNLVIPALVVPEFEGLKTAFSGFGLTFDYFPTSTEWLLTVWVVSIAGLIFLAGYHFLPVSKSEQIG